MARLRNVPWTGVFAVVAALGLAIGMTYLVHQQRISAEDRASQAAEIDALQAVVDEANQRLAAAGESPVDVPAATAPPERGQQGDRGEPGRGPLPSEISLAVESYCMVRDDCRGADGNDGADGKAGQDGKPGADGKSVKGDKGDPGEPGRAPTADEVLAAVTAYCGQPSAPCKGSPGDPGTPGGPGMSGRGIADVTCQEDGTWLVTYTDQTTSTTPGPCRFQLIPTPEETP